MPELTEEQIKEAVSVYYLTRDSKNHWSPELGMREAATHLQYALTEPGAPLSDEELSLFRGISDTHDWLNYRQIDHLNTILAKRNVRKEEYTYASTQHTYCAGCGQDVHTPLRRDEMGGYVCLTCIDKKLNRYKEEPIKLNLPEKRISVVWSNDKASVNLFEDGVTIISMPGNVSNNITLNRLRLGLIEQLRKENLE